MAHDLSAAEQQTAASIESQVKILQRSPHDS
jgi:hypothetical protein